MVVAVNQIDLDLAAGQTLGLVGESGSGKSTTARAVLRLVDTAAGQIRAAGHDVERFGRRVPLGFRRAVQAVFQDPQGSLDPTKLIGDIIAEPLAIHFDYSKRSRRERVNDLLDQVGLSPQHADRYPYQLSGGQRQRVAIAKALAVEPELIILDEPVSALDVSVQSQVVNLLESVQERTGLSYLFVAHDLAVVRHASDEIAVMYRSRIVEQGPADRICDAPAHPYTQALLAAVPNPDPVRQAAQRARRRELRSRAAEISPPVGGATWDSCPFVTRCPHAMGICTTSFPDWSAVDGGGRVACHLFTTDNVTINNSVS